VVWVVWWCEWARGNRSTRHARGRAAGTRRDAWHDTVWGKLSVNGCVESGCDRGGRRSRLGCRACRSPRTGWWGRGGRRERREREAGGRELGKRGALLLAMGGEARGMPTWGCRRGEGGRSGAGGGWGAGRGGGTSAWRGRVGRRRMCEGTRRSYSCKREQVFKTVAIGAGRSRRQSETIWAVLEEGRRRTSVVQYERRAAHRTFTFFLLLYYF
jgi:hypothetical protein